MKNPSWLAALTDPRVAFRDPFSLLDPIVDVQPVGTPQGGLSTTLVCWLLLATTPVALAVAQPAQPVDHGTNPPAAARAVVDNSGLREIMLGDLFTRGVGTRPDPDRAEQHYAAAMRAGNQAVGPRFGALVCLEPVATGPLR